MTFRTRSLVRSAEYGRRLSSRGVALACGVLALVMGVLVPAPRAGAQSPLDRYQMSAVLLYGPYYPPGSWVPIRIEIRNDSDAPLDGQVRIPLKPEARRSGSGGGDADAPRSPEVELQLPVMVPGRSRIVTTAYGYFPESARPQFDNPNAARQVREGTAETGSLTTVELFAGGARVARAPLLGQSGMGGDSGSGGGTLLLGLFGDRPPPDPAAPDPAGFQTPVIDLPDTVYDLTLLGDTIEAAGSTAIAPSSADLHRAPRRRVAYEPTRYVLLDQARADELDPPQRQALLAHITSGGVLIVPGPLTEAEASGTWLEPYMPVRVIGQREMSRIVAAPAPAAGRAAAADNGATTAAAGNGATAADVAARTYPLATTLPVTEAVEADPGTDPSSAPRVVLRDEHFVHAAYRPVGLGRVVFVSFPMGALSETDDRTLTLWRTLLDASAPAPGDWSATRLPAERDTLLESMIGVPTAPWSLAAIVAGAYVGVVVLLHLAFGGPRRPMAFAVVVGLAVIASGALLALARARHEGQQLTGARLATMDLTPTGGGIYRQVTTYLGTENPDFALAAADPAVTLRPIVSASPVTLTLEPFAAPAAGVHAGKIERVWEAARPVPPETRLDATGAFGPNGLTLTVNNPLGSPLASPVLLWGNVFRLAGAGGDATLPPGESTFTRLERNARGDYANVAVIASEVDKLRGDILRAAETPAQDMLVARGAPPGPRLAAWLDETAIPPLLDADPTDPVMRGHVLVRAPVRIDPSPVGSRVRVDGGFSRLELGEARGLPFDLVKREFIPSAQIGQWLIALSPPPEIGTLRPARVTLTADAASPAHTITFRKNQVPANGRPRENLASDADIAARWVSPIGQQTASFDVGPGDFDRFGRVWLLLQVDKSDAAGDSLTPWSFRSLDLSYDDAEVTGPPASALDLQAATSPPPRRSAGDAKDDDAEEAGDAEPADPATNP